MPSLTPLGTIIEDLFDLIESLAAEFVYEEYQSRWPEASGNGYITTQHGSSPDDPVARTALQPDSVNGDRAARIERALRKAHEDLAQAKMVRRSRRYRTG